MITVFFHKNEGGLTNVQKVKVPEGTTIMEAAKFFAEPSIEQIPATCVVLARVALVMFILEMVGLTNFLK